MNRIRMRRDFLEAGLFFLAAGVLVYQVSAILFAAPWKDDRSSARNPAVARTESISRDAAPANAAEQRFPGPVVDRETLVEPRGSEPREIIKDAGRPGNIDPVQQAAGSQKLQELPANQDAPAPGEGFTVAVAVPPRADQVLLEAPRPNAEGELPPPSLEEGLAGNPGDAEEGTESDLPGIPASQLKNMSQEEISELRALLMEAQKVPEHHEPLPGGEAFPGGPPPQGGGHIGRDNNVEMPIPVDVPPGRSGT